MAWGKVRMEGLIAEAAGAARLTHGPGPPRQIEGWMIERSNYFRGEKAAGIRILFS
jgi:hypothetical protein